MKTERYTDHARGLIETAHSRAVAVGHQRLTSEHILKELLDDKEELASKLVRASSANVEVLREAAKAALSRFP